MWSKSILSQGLHVAYQILTGVEVNGVFWLQALQSWPSSLHPDVTYRGWLLRSRVAEFL
jgi:hypothetical protein